MKPIRLGVNVDHVATLRNARGGPHPDPLLAAQAAIAAGADGITAHLREDRRHIRDEDMFRLKAEIEKPLNFEMAATPEMESIALRVRPHAVCLVPERRAEVTTEGGLDVVTYAPAVAPIVGRLTNAGIRVSLFVDPDMRQLEAAKRIGAPVVELHTGSYAHVSPAHRAHELTRLRDAARATREFGLECHAGHGLTFGNVEAIAALPEIVELNIGHFLVGEAVLVGLDRAVRVMRQHINSGRAAMFGDPA